MSVYTYTHKYIYAHTHTHLNIFFLCGPMNRYVPSRTKRSLGSSCPQTPCYMEAMNLFNFSTEARLLRLADEDAMHDLVSLRRIVCEQKSFPLEGTASTKWLRAGLYHLEISFVCLTLPQSIGRHLSTIICLLRSSQSVWAQTARPPGSSY